MGRLENGCYFASLVRNRLGSLMCSFLGLPHELSYNSEVGMGWDGGKIAEEIISLEKDVNVMIGP